MGGVGHETALGLEGGVQPAEHLVEGVGQLLELVLGPLEVDPLVQGVPSSRRAVAVMALSGRRTRPATSQPSPTETSAARARATPDWPRSWRRVAACSWRRTASASRRTWRTASGEGALAMKVSPPSPAGGPHR